MDSTCPWCGEELFDPFSGKAVSEGANYDRALEAHAEECDAYLAEQGE